MTLRSGRPVRAAVLVIRGYPRTADRGANPITSWDPLPAWRPGQERHFQHRSDTCSAGGSDRFRFRLRYRGVVGRGGAQRAWKGIAGGRVGRAWGQQRLWFKRRRLARGIPWLHGEVRFRRRRRFSGKWIAGERVGRQFFGRADFVESHANLLLLASNAGLLTVERFRRHDCEAGRRHRAPDTVVEAVRPHRSDGHGQAWRLLVAQHEQIRRS